jgi:lysophospholipase L1-like esterase
MKKLIYILMLIVLSLSVFGAIPTPTYYYDFDNNVDDLTGSNDGTIVGSLIPWGEDDCMQGTCYQGQDGNNYIDLDSTFSLTADWSIAWWVKNLTEVGTAIFMGNTGQSTSWIGQHGSSITSFKNSGGGFGPNVACDVNNAESFSLVVVSASSSGTTTNVYCNLTKGTASGTSQTISNVDDLLTGYTSRDYNYDGVVDEVAIWTGDALTDSQVAELFNNGDGMFYNGSVWENVSTPEEPPAEPTPEITLLTPSVGTTLFYEDYNVTISVNYNTTCKYKEGGLFDYDTDGTLMSGSLTNHGFLLDINEDKTYNYSYSCKLQNDTIVNITNHYFYGKETNWTNNYFVMIGDSVTAQTALSSSDRTAERVEYYLNNEHDIGTITSYNSGINNCCLSDYGGCSTHDPMVNRYETDLIDYQGRFAFIQASVNDHGYSGNLDEYIIDFKTIIDALNTAGNYKYFSGTLSPYISEGGQSEYNKTNKTIWNARIREFFITNEIPYWEQTFYFNFSSVNIYDYVHPSSTGADMWAEHIVDMIFNTSDYIDTIDEFNIYHDCNNAISVFNYSVYSPTMNCYTNRSSDWLVLKDLTTEDFTIERSDKPFMMNITDKYLINQTYYIEYSGTNHTYTSNENGDILDISFPATTNTFVKFYAVIPPPNLTNYTPSQLNFTTSENTTIEFDAEVDSVTTISFKWFLNGIIQAVTKAWNWIIGFDDASTDNNITLIYNDTEGQYGSQTWFINVSNLNLQPTINDVSVNQDVIYPSISYKVLCDVEDDSNASSVLNVSTYYKESAGVWTQLVTTYQGSNIWAGNVPALTHSIGDVISYRCVATDLELETSVAQLTNYKTISEEQTAPTIPEVLSPTGSEYKYSIPTLCFGSIDNQSNQRISYEMQVRKNNTGDWFMVENITGILLSAYNIYYDGLNTKYDFRCRAYDGFDHSAWKYEYNASTKKNIPVLKILQPGEYEQFIRNRPYQLSLFSDVEDLNNITIINSYMDCNDDEVWDYVKEHDNEETIKETYSCVNDRGLITQKMGVVLFKNDSNPWKGVCTSLPPDIKECIWSKNFKVVVK